MLGQQACRPKKEDRKRKYSADPGQRKKIRKDGSDLTGPDDRNRSRRDAGPAAQRRARAPDNAAERTAAALAKEAALLARLGRCSTDLRRAAATNNPAAAVKALCELEDLGHVEQGVSSCAGLEATDLIVLLKRLKDPKTYASASVPSTDQRGGLSEAVTHAIKLATNLSERWDAAIPAIKERNDADPARAQQVKEGLEDTIKCATIREKCRKAIETVSYDSPISETVIRNRNKVADFLRSIGLKYKQGTPTERELIKSIDRLDGSRFKERPSHLLELLEKVAAMPDEDVLLVAQRTRAAVWFHQIDDTVEIVGSGPATRFHDSDGEWVCTYIPPPEDNRPMERCGRLLHRLFEEAEKRNGGKKVVDHASSAKRTHVCDAYFKHGYVYRDDVKGNRFEKHVYRAQWETPTEEKFNGICASDYKARGTGAQV